MVDSSEKREYVEEKKPLDKENPAVSQQTIGTKEEVLDDTGKEDVVSQVSPESDEGHETEEDDEHDVDNTNGVPVRPQSSRASSIFSRSQTVIPRAQRRGLFGSWAVIPEIERPHEYTTKTKWTITAIIALAAAAAPIGAGIFYRTSSLF